jgi:hypothetical protein
MLESGEITGCSEFSRLGWYNQKVIYLRYEINGVFFGIQRYKAEPLDEA